MASEKYTKPTNTRHSKRKRRKNETRKSQHPEKRGKTSHRDKKTAQKENTHSLGSSKKPITWDLTNIDDEKGKENEVVSVIEEGAIEEIEKKSDVSDDEEMVTSEKDTLGEINNVLKPALVFSPKERKEIEKFIEKTCKEWRVAYQGSLQPGGSLMQEKNNLIFRVPLHIGAERFVEYLKIFYLKKSDSRRNISIDKDNSVRIKGGTPLTLYNKVFPSNIEVHSLSEQQEPDSAEIENLIKKTCKDWRENVYKGSLATIKNLTKKENNIIFRIKSLEEAQKVVCYLKKYYLTHPQAQRNIEVKEEEVRIVGRTSGTLYKEYEKVYGINIVGRESTPTKLTVTSDQENDKLLPEEIPSVPTQPTEVETEPNLYFEEEFPPAENEAVVGSCNNPQVMLNPTLTQENKTARVEDPTQKEVLLTLTQTQISTRKLVNQEGEKLRLDIEEFFFQREAFIEKLSNNPQEKETEKEMGKVNKLQGESDLEVGLGDKQENTRSQQRERDATTSALIERSLRESRASERKRKKQQEERKEEKRREEKKDQYKLAYNHRWMW